MSEKWKEFETRIRSIIEPILSAQGYKCEIAEDSEEESHDGFIFVYEKDNRGINIDVLPWLPLPLYQSDPFVSRDWITYKGTSRKNLRLRALKYGRKRVHHIRIYIPDAEGLPLQLKTITNSAQVSGNKYLDSYSTEGWIWAYITSEQLDQAIDQISHTLQIYFDKYT